MRSASSASLRVRFRSPMSPTMPSTLPLTWVMARNISPLPGRSLWLPRSSMRLKSSAISVNRGHSGSTARRTARKASIRSGPGAPGGGVKLSRSPSSAVRTFCASTARFIGPIIESPNRSGTTIARTIAPPQPRPQPMTHLRVVLAMKRPFASGRFATLHHPRPDHRAQAQDENGRHPLRELGPCGYRRVMVSCFTQFPDPVSGCR